VLLGLVRRGRLLALAGVVTLALVVLVVPGVRRRAESIADPADPTARERLAMWRSGMAMAREHPLTGIGPGQVKRQYSRYVAPEFREKPRGHLHSTPMQILVERGLLGLGAWAGIFLAFFRRAARILRALPAESAPQRALVTGSMAAIAGFLVGGLTEYNFGDSEVVLTAYAVMVLPFVVERSLAGATAGVRSSGL
jgi:O-antigen ligase